MAVTTDIDEIKTRLLKRRLIASTGCWLWKGALSAGYGTVGIAPQISRSAHRLAYIAFVGPIPKGLEIDHLCGIPSCINPEHLEPVTRAENCRRAKAARAAGRPRYILERRANS